MTTNKERSNESMALERRRRWSAEAKRDIVQETYQHGNPAMVSRMGNSVGLYPTRETVPERVHRELQRETSR